MSQIAADPEASQAARPRIERLRDFVVSFAELLDVHSSEADVLKHGGALLSKLVAIDDWLPEDFAQPDPERYRQYLLHTDSRERFSVVSFVWGPGQSTPIHNHTVWGLIGVLRGAEDGQRFRFDQGRLVEDGGPERLERGAIEAVSPTVGDIHRVSNAFADRTSISIHVYGANIGGVSRSVFAPDGTPKKFISGYSNSRLPNLWDRSSTPG
ncbi:MAG TPA: cysteine dioxygenase [Rhodocyclaceae bacterium]|nr:cysteine dioxygenase [Rhodocyclaceae bacterium]